MNAQLLFCYAVDYKKPPGRKTIRESFVSSGTVVIGTAERFATSSAFEVESRTKSGVRRSLSIRSWGGSIWWPWPRKYGDDATWRGIMRFKDQCCQASMRQPMTVTAPKALPAVGRCKLVVSTTCALPSRNLCRSRLRTSPQCRRRASDQHQAPFDGSPDAARRHRSSYSLRADHGPGI